MVEGIWNSKREGLLQRYTVANCHRKWGLVVLESGKISFKTDFQHAKKDGGIKKRKGVRRHIREGGRL